MRINLSPQTRKTVLKRIKTYLRNNPTEMKGIRSFQRNHLESLITRLNEFSPIETLNWNIPDRRLFREVAVAAGIQFVRDYPMLYHTPNSLRACFGMPTRTDRKKGRFSSIFYRNEAVERQLQPRIDDFDELLEKVRTVNHEGFLDEVEILHRYIKRVKGRRYNDDILDAPESDHSELSIGSLRKFLEEFGFENLQEATETTEEHLQDLDGVVLAPDMIGRWKGKECWIELKEYRDLRFNSKVVFQIFRYLHQNPFVFLVSTSSLDSFSQLLKQRTWTPKTLQNWALKQKEQLQDIISGWNSKREKYRALGRMLKLDPRFEALLLTLTNEIVIREIGLSGTELKGIEKFLDLVGNFQGEITVCDFEDIMMQREIPTDYCLMMKMDFPFDSFHRSKTN